MSYHDTNPKDMFSDVVAKKINDAKQLRNMIYPCTVISVLIYPCNVISVIIYPCNVISVIKN